MSNKGLVALIMIAMIMIASVAVAGGNFYIPGSRDGEGGIGEDGKSFLNIHGTTDITMEGATSDAYEAIIRIPDPASDIVYTMPAASGTLATTTGGDVTLTDTFLFVGSSSNLAVGVTVSGDVAITNAGVTTLAVNSVSAPQLGLINVVTATVLAGQTGVDLNVEPGSLFLNFEQISGFTNDATLNKNSYDSASGAWIINTSTTIGATTLVINGTFLRP